MIALLLLSSTVRIGGRVLELNLDPSLGSVHFRESRMGNAGDMLPARVVDVLA